MSHFLILGDGRTASFRRILVFPRSSDHRLAFCKSRIRKRDTSQQPIAQALGSGDCNNFIKFAFLFVLDRIGLQIIN
jgi:hypothetical protein